VVLGRREGRGGAREARGDLGVLADRQRRRVLEGHGRQDDHAVGQLGRDGTSVEHS
jgi:hypothetical protein